MATGKWGDEECVRGVDDEHHVEVNCCDGTSYPSRGRSLSPSRCSAGSCCCRCRRAGTRCRGCRSFRGRSSRFCSARPSPCSTFPSRRSRWSCSEWSLCRRAQCGLGNPLRSLLWKETSLLHEAGLWWIFV